MCLVAEFFSNGNTTGGLAWDELPAAQLDAVSLILKEKRYIEKGAVSNASEDQ